MLSQTTTYLANRLCGGSSRKLIAGWWYSILAVTAVLMVLSIAVMGRSSFTYSFCGVWSAMILVGISIGGTMIMRKFHNSFAVGFFMGCVVAGANLCLSVGWNYWDTELGLSVLQFVQAVLLGTFAAILAAHRSEILDDGTLDTASDYQRTTA